MNYLTLCCIAKDENAYLPEWIALHARLGVERFIVYDNESAVPLRETLAPFMRGDFLTVVEIAGRCMQLPAYSHCLTTFGAASRWIGFIDADEFLLPAPGEPDDLRLLLADYEPYAGLGVNWTMFGSSGHLRRPEGLVTASYTHRYPRDHHANMHIKSIVQPARVADVKNAHEFAYKGSHTCVDEECWPVYGPFSLPRGRRLRLHHYYFRSQEDYCRKVARGRADTGEPQPLNEFYRQLEAANIEDRSALRFVPGLERDLADPALLPRRARKFAATGLESWLTRFQQALVRGEHEAALRFLDSARVHHGAEHALWTVRASFLRLEERLDEALESVRQSLRRHHSPEAYLELMRIHAAAGRPDEALGVAAFLRTMMRGNMEARQDFAATLERETRALLDRRP